MPKKLVAHSVIATSCELNSPGIACPPPLQPSHHPLPRLLIVTYAHSVFATACEFNSPDIVSPRRSSVNRRGPVVF
jgi:hypothetical protein